MIKKTYFADIVGASVSVAPWEGVVQSIYSKAVNLLHPSGVLISLVDSIDNMTDFGLVVKNFSLLISEISNGSHFLWEGNRIIFSDIIVDISRASEWSGALSKDSINNSADMASLKRAFNKLATDEGLSPVLTNKEGNIYSNAAEKLLEKAVTKVNISKGTLVDLSHLVGLGIGFTPSGDDFLAGVMLFEAMYGTSIINRTIIKAKLSGTTEGGGTLLQLALRNSFPFYLKQFAESILNGSFYPSEGVTKVIKHGSTSGSDALTGFLWAVEKNEKNSLINLT
ncbi:MAG: hypothetical protein DRP58_03120 [Spirochaetes bacterium]|nr:MAG: hypothetical protein DRP58_03120 [Spirochaetota bacterium]